MKVSSAEEKAAEGENRTFNVPLRGYNKTRVGASVLHAYRKGPNIMA